MNRAAVVAVVLFLLAVPALYAVAVTQESPTEVQLLQGGIDYNGSTNFSYRAYLAPNPLFPPGPLGPGDGTLFEPLVQTLTLNCSYALSVNAPVTVTGSVGYTLLADGTLWNLTLNSSATRLPAHSAGPGDPLLVSEATTVNMTETERLLGEVANATGYSPSALLLRLIPSLAFTIMPQAGPVVRLVYAPAFNMTIVNGLILPGPLTATNGGRNGTLVVQHPPNVRLDQELAIAAAALLLLGGAVAGTVAARQELRERRTSDTVRALRKLTAPYQDAIAMTGTPPSTRNVVGLGTWEGLVRVADMLGKPILRYEHDSSAGPTRYFFYVLDGTVQYTYLVPRDPAERIR
ncbi:MAG: DUF5305 family protein [Thermoplasmata archaeon]